MSHAHIVWLRDNGQSLDGFRLPAHEQNEMQGFKQVSRQRRFLLSRLLLRQMLSVLLPGEEPHFTRAPSGRLLLAGDSGWHISLSHAETGIAVLLAQAPCGIDIEAPRRVAMEKIAARYFSAQENQDLQAAAAADRPALFFRLWTLKEASVKALGEGLADNMARLAFDVRGEQPRPYASSPALQLWQDYAAPNFIAAAIASSGRVHWHSREANIAELAEA